MKNTIVLILAMSTISFSKDVEYYNYRSSLGAFGGLLFTKYINTPYGGISYNSMNNKGYHEVTMGMGYAQEDISNRLRETVRIFGISYGFMFKINRMIYIGPLIGNISIDHQVDITGIDYSEPPIETMKTNNLFGGKAALIVGEKSKAKMKMQASLIAGPYSEDEKKSDGFYHNDSGIIITPEINIGIIICFK